MILKGLEMQGFKSFPDRTYLEFGKGMTAVVGPNGSGKSNISDAVRWVLGEQSTKTLRGSKMEDVIFSGTGARKALGFAQVTLHLDNTDRSLSRDDDDISITRRFYRSGDSEYKINGETCRLRDIHELFMDTGLGRDGYSIVSQGKIADLVSAKSNQRRDMLEEAAGISHLRYRRNDANRKLEQAEDNLVRLRDILAELEGRIGPLKIQSEKAIKFLALADEKKTLEIGLWLHTIERCKNGLVEQEKKLSFAVAQYEATQEQIEKIAERLDEALSHARELTVEVENLRQSIADAEENAAIVDGKINVEKNTVEHNNATIARIKADMGDDAKSTADIDDKIASLHTDIELKDKEKSEINDSLIKETASLNELLCQLGENGKEISKITTLLSQANSDSSDLRVEKQSEISSTNELNERIDNIDGILSSRGDIITRLETEKKEAADKIRELNEKIAENDNFIDGYQMMFNAKNEKCEKLRKETDDINLNIYQRNARIRLLDDLEKNLDGYAGSVQKVIKESNKGALRGIHGTVSQLITVPAKYSVAVETALGAAIQNVVTDDETSAKRAINFLKETRAGRATFLPLTSVKGRDFTEKGLENCEGFIDMGDNLVTCDSKYKGIISNLLSKTAVVETIDDAISIAKKYSYRFKIVTLDGQVLNAGGSMTGGSRGAGSGLLSRMNEIDDLKGAVEALEKELKEKTQKLNSFEDELNQINAQLTAGEDEQTRLQEELIRAESDLKLKEDRLNSSKGHIEELENEKKLCQSKIAESKKKIDAINLKLADIINEIASLNEQADSLNDGREKIDELREKSSEKQAQLNLKILALDKEIEASLSQISELEYRKENFTQRNEALLNEIADIEKQNAEKLELISAMENEAKAIRENAFETNKRIAALVEERNTTEQGSTVLRAQEREMSDDKEKLNGELARLEERKCNLQKDLESAQNKLYDEYQLTLSEAQQVGKEPEDIGEAQRRLSEIKNKIRGLGSVNVGAVEEYKEVSERYEYMSTQLKDIETSKIELTRLIDELTGKMSERFKEQFKLINASFGETFAELFSGGKAELSPEDKNDILECNINIKVQPPGKNVQNIDLLSGGEKGLAAIALLIAILKVNPAPFCIFDEVEAALDDVNVSRYATYLRGMCDNIQFILITHRRGTMDEADILYGVTMQEEGVSKLLELKSSEMAKKLGLEN